jgi:hypothetical protein
MCICVYTCLFCYSGVWAVVCVCVCVCVYTCVCIVNKKAQTFYLIWAFRYTHMYMCVYTCICIRVRYQYRDLFSAHIDPNWVAIYSPQHVRNDLVLTCEDQYSQSNVLHHAEE